MKMPLAPIEERRGHGHGCASSLFLSQDVHQMLSHGPCVVCDLWSCRPQPLVSGRDATPCEDARQEHGLSKTKCVRRVQGGFNPSGRDLGSNGRRPQNRTARTADASQRKCSRSARLEERAAI